MPDELYHYTTAAYADDVQTSLATIGESMFEIMMGTHGPGLYALDVEPGDAESDELRYMCFSDWRPEHPMDGVLVLDALLLPGFVNVDERVWLWQAEVGDLLSLSAIVLATGIRVGADWELSDV